MTIRSTLSAYFAGAAGKYLSVVEADPKRSRQHEFNGVEGLRQLLGEPPIEKHRFHCKYVYLDDEADPLVVDSTATWYEGRPNGRPTRPHAREARLYYPDNDVMQVASPGDYMTIAVPSAHAGAAELVVIVSPGRSTVAAQLQHLFGLEPSDRLDVQSLPGDEDLNFTSRQLLETLGFDTAQIQDSYLDDIVARFGNQFPTTAEFSTFCRATLPDVDAMADPDTTLLTWMDQEESLYRTFERYLVTERLAEAGSDVDRVLEIAMQTFQRRRSRAGHALENHTAHLLTLHGVRFVRQARTEGSKKPDFLFPGRDEYSDAGFPDAHLFMLGVKTTCKDRWRQVLTEADRIPAKHLLTLEAPISLAQTREMSTRALSLVVPRPLHDLFDPMQRTELLSLAGFMDLAKTGIGQ